MKQIPKTYPLYLEGLNRELPIVEVVPGVSIAVLKIATDADFTEAAGKALFHRMPYDAEVLVMPDGKAQTLLHVLQRETGLPAVLARKERKSYMKEPVLETPAVSITTQKRHAFFLDADDVELVRGRKAVIVDDVISSGGTIKAMQALLELAGARATVLMAIGTEGEKREDVIALHHFPVYLHDA